MRPPDCIYGEDKPICLSCFTGLYIYSSRILVPGLPGIELININNMKQEFNRVDNKIRPAILKLDQLDDAGCADLLLTLQTKDLTDDHLVCEVIGFAAAAGSIRESLRIGELKTLLALAVGNKSATLEGCNWIHHFEHIDESRRRVYLCVESLINLHKTEMFHHSLELMYGTETLYLAMDLLKRKQRFFGLEESVAEISDTPRHEHLPDADD